MMKIRIIVLAAVCISWSAQATVFTAAISQDSLYVGDRLLFNVTILVPKGAAIVPPPTEAGFGKFIVKEWNSGKVEKKSADSLTFSYIITQYTTEQCTLPPVPFIQTVDGKTDTLSSKPMPIRLVLLHEADSTVASIKGLKPQQKAGSPSLSWLWLLLGAAAAAVAIYFLSRLIKKRGKGLRAAPPKPPYEEAMEALRLLEEKQYIARGMIREYVFELSDIFKRYIERRFDVNAAEFTTEEMLDWIMRSKLGPEDKKTCDWFFRATDPVKFAKMRPDSDTLNRFGPEVRQFIERTKPMPEATAQPKDASHAT